MFSFMFKPFIGIYRTLDSVLIYFLLSVLNQMWQKMCKKGEKLTHDCETHECEEQPSSHDEVHVSAIPAATSYRSLSQKHCSGCNGMPKMRAKEKAKEGHIYISSGQERREKTKFIFDCLKMNGKRRLLHVDPWYLETKAAMTFSRNQNASVLALIEHS